MSIHSLIAFCLLVIVPQTALAQSKPAQKPAPAAAAPKAPAATPAPAPEATPAGPAAGQNPEPKITTTIFGEWALRCQQDPANRANCEVSLTIQQKNQQAPIAKIALGRPPGSAGMQLLILLPPNVSFPSSVQIRSDDSKDLSGFDIPWQRCIPGACLAGTTLSDADLIRWHALDNAGRITFKDAQTNEIGIEFSFHGLGQALDALAKAQ